MLYDIALKGKAPGDSLALFATLRDTHQSYAQAVSGFLGRLAPNTAATELVDSMKSAFGAISLKEIASAAYDLESVLMATHQELVGKLIGTNGAALLASILIAEARHATVLADIGGHKDLDTLLLSDAAALEPKKG